MNNKNTETTKVCTACNIEKPLEEFYSRKNSKQNRRAQCKACHNINVNLTRSQNILNKWCPDHKNVRPLEGKKYCQICLDNHKTLRNASVSKGFCQSHPKRPAITKWRCLECSIASTLRARLSAALKNNYKQSSAVKDLGCTIPQFKIYIAMKFQPGMTWSNHGEGPGKWNIDHIIPLASFELADPNQQKLACHHTNLQPLWSTDNLQKSDKLDWSP